MTKIEKSLIAAVVALAFLAGMAAAPAKADPYYTTKTYSRDIGFGRSVIVTREVKVDDGIRTLRQPVTRPDICGGGFASISGGASQEGCIRNTAPGR